MDRRKRKRLESLARQAAYASGHELAEAQDFAYKRFLIAREACKRNYHDVYEVTLKGLMAQHEEE